MIAITENTVRTLLEGTLLDLSRDSRAFDGSLPTREFEDWMLENVGYYAKNVVSYTRFNMGWMLFPSSNKANCMSLVIRDPQKVMMIKLAWA